MKLQVDITAEGVDAAVQALDAILVQIDEAGETNGSTAGDGFNGRFELLDTPTAD